jgi:acetyltransferase-like isoleucine patch superfamily enzyme
MRAYLTRTKERLRRRLYLFYPKLFKIKYGKALRLGDGVLFKGLPLIDMRDGARISLGDSVTLNSCNFGHHVLLHSSVKIMADREGAIIEVGDNTRIHGSCLHAYKRISIGKGCLIGANTNIIDGNGHDLAFDNVEKRYTTIGEAEDVIIEDNVWIGMNCIVLPGTHIGHGSVISAGSVIRGNVPPFCIFGGNPARLVKQYEETSSRTDGGLE